MYGIELNLPNQAGQDFKEKAMARLTPCPESGVLTSWTNKGDRQFATEDRETAEAFADTYAESWDATVVPVDDGRVLSPEETDTALGVLRERAQERKKVERQLARVR